MWQQKGFLEPIREAWPGVCKEAGLDPDGQGGVFGQPEPPTLAVVHVKVKFVVVGGWVNWQMPFTFGKVIFRPVTVTGVGVQYQ